MESVGPSSSAPGRPRRFGATAERVAYTLFAAASTLWVACRFYASMRLQVQYTSHLPLASANDWSAPLDDVFIHFDFARAIARGHPFEWSEGNGYSTGGTSVLYPFVLAFGYWIGFRKLALVLWAALVACVSTFALLLASRRMFRDLPRYTSWLAPLAVLGIGALDWNLFSGMEVAFFLAIWAGALIAWDDAVRGPPDGAPPSHPLRWAALLGAWGFLLTATRPEAVVIAGIFSLALALALWRRVGQKRALLAALAAGLPAVGVIVAQAIANRVLTGNATASGALVKLELYHPYMSAREVWDAWVFHSKYQLFRIAEYHFTDVVGFGWIPFGFAGFALLPRQTRRYALLLGASAVAWVLVTGLNGQVRWQNERYTMPAVAWLMLAAALGAGALVGRAWALGRRGRVIRALAVTACLAGIGLFGWHQAPRFRDQVWFFGRASRNIRDQHIRVGRLLADMQPEPPHRVLVGDAGAIPYVSDLPALDIIGLGGYHGLPFASATRQGLGAAIELIERMPPGDRPDLLAIYPSWWGVFPLWFGEELGEVPVSGNVICGGAADVLYRSHWGALDESGVPAALPKGDMILDEVDFADLISERRHDFVSSVGIPHIEMKLLPRLTEPARDLWDAGRSLPAGSQTSFALAALVPGKANRLVFRLAPSQPGKLRVRADGREIGTLDFVHEDGWIEPSLVLPPDLAKARVTITLEPLEHELVVHHLWAVEPR